MWPVDCPPISPLALPLVLSLSTTRSSFPSLPVLTTPCIGLMCNTGNRSRILAGHHGGRENTSTCISSLRVPRPAMVMMPCSLAATSFHGGAGFALGPCLCAVPPAARRNATGAGYRPRFQTPETKLHAPPLGIQILQPKKSTLIAAEFFDCPTPRARRRKKNRVLACSTPIFQCRSPMQGFRPPLQLSRSHGITWWVAICLQVVYFRRGRLDDSALGALPPS
ncbi:hypothetical protein GQ53DRAFT_549603 [Thozetella sp. PMI_491]|nr:hypothetical protein GQ53DRAFT_549603 [Thozetella sp. PMI_491]